MSATLSPESATDDNEDVMADIGNPEGELLEGQVLDHCLAEHPGIDWAAAAWIGIVHLGALAAPFTFSFTGLGVMLALYFLTGCIGICLGYHRLLSHKSFETYRPVRWLIAWIGGLAGEGSAIHWCANHRIHHAKSDHEGDPHSPREGFLWSHMLWCMQRIGSEDRRAMHRRWVPDLLKDPVLRFLDTTFLLWQIVIGLVLAGVGYAIDGPAMAASLVVWGVFVRMVIVLHATWCINSVTHVWGYKTYDNGDDSKNLWWVAVITFGEGWHNNHHAYQKAANYGHRWWEFDTTYQMIRLLKFTGLAWSIAPIPQRALEILAKKRLASHI
ncbi:acyl-CoA desaturase [Stieleria varia]|uniref:Fatty acid desaturase n=1 Tax=Stieleria varia TaxID=2528005 RepID=A0A5C6B9V7_9BACT|nr:fatty acid desaturase [Stieleria varia]TWU08507.1 Fatty acid desaturase [Stieleria varia]